MDFELTWETQTRISPLFFTTSYFKCSLFRPNDILLIICSVVKCTSQFEHVSFSPSALISPDSHWFDYTFAQSDISNCNIKNNALCNTLVARRTPTGAMATAPCQNSTLVNLVIFTSVTVIYTRRALFIRIAPHRTDWMWTWRNKMGWIVSTSFDVLQCNRADD